MKHLTVCLLVIILIIGVIACTAPPSISTTTPNSSANQTPTFTFAPSASLTPYTPTVVNIATLLMPTTLTNTYIIPVEFTHPIILISDQFRVTVTGVSNVGDSTIATTEEPYTIVVPEDQQDTHYLLQLELTVEKLTDGPLGFGSARTAWSLVSKLDDGTFDVPVGWCELSRQNCAPVFIITLIDNHPANLFVLFVVPNEAKQIYLYLLGSVPIPHM